MTSVPRFQLRMGRGRCPAHQADGDKCDQAASVASPTIILHRAPDSCLQPLSARRHIPPSGEA
jgi:hypothetical protein